MRPAKKSNGLNRVLLLLPLLAAAFGYGISGVSAKAQVAEGPPTYPPPGQPTTVLDDITFGDDLSEQTHGLKAEKSEDVPWWTGPTRPQAAPGRKPSVGRRHFGVDHEGRSGGAELCHSKVVGLG